MITPAECRGLNQLELYHQMKAGSDIAREKLILSVYYLAQKIAYSFSVSIPNASLEELQGEVLLALPTIIDKWDPNQSKLSTYTTHSLQHVLTKQMPQCLTGDAAIRFKNNFFRELKPAITLRKAGLSFDAIQKQLQFSEVRMQALQFYFGKRISNKLKQVTITYKHKFPGDEMELGKYIGRLSPQEQYLIKRLYLDNLSRAALGQEFDMTKQGICCREKRILHKLRHFFWEDCHGRRRRKNV